MKVTDASPTNISMAQKEKKKLTAEEVKKRVQEKFGSKVLDKKQSKPPLDTVELKGKQRLEPEAKGPIGDIAKNDPNDIMTHDKIKNVLKSGAFDFNEQERAALAKILK